MTNKQNAPQHPAHVDDPSKTGAWKTMGFRFLAMCAGLLAALLLVEALLRLTPGLFGPTVLDLAFSRYNSSPGGMHVNDKRKRVRFMRANFQVRTYSHGYWWNHSTDALGFRNPNDLERRDVLLLGDSFIYGHGVEEDQTVAHFLRTEHGIAAYNMGRQGNCLYENYLTYRLYAEDLKPKTVFLFVFLNDVLDLESRRRPLELADPPEISRYRYANIRNRVTRLQNEIPPWTTRVVLSSALARIVYGYLNVRSMSEQMKPGNHRGLPADTTTKNEPDHSPSGTDQVSVSTTDTRKNRGVTTNRYGKLIPQGKKRKSSSAPVLDEKRFRPVRNYYDLVLGDLDERCKENGTRFVVVQLFFEKTDLGPRHLRTQQKIRRMLGNISRRRNIEFFDTWELYKQCEKCFLPDDGHLSATGHQRLAGFLAEILSDNRVPVEERLQTQ